MLHYDLVVLQYGLNIMQKGQRGYSRYRDQLRDMIAYAERCFPDAAIMVMGVSDRWIKNEETSKYESIGSVDALTSYQRAAADSCGVAFWNTSKAMAQLGGMPQFVANGWAANDYTHINFQGGKRIALELAEAITEQVRIVLEAREAEQARLEELERQRKEMAERYLQSQIDSVWPIVESVEQEQTE
jgi:lysophospholipase L1-like esterase